MVQQNIHMQAKKAIYEAVHKWKQKDGPCPNILRICVQCRTIGSQCLPEKVENVAIDFDLSDGSKADIVFLSEGKPLAAVFIVTQNNAEKRSVSILPWMVLIAEEVIKEPLLWKPAQDGLRRYVCQTCRNSGNQRQQITARYEASYKTKHIKCWQCGQRIVVFTWKGHQAWGKDKPPEPIPPSIRWVWSETIQAHYWANTCSSCKVLQGDFFLYCEPDGPFF